MHFFQMLNKQYLIFLEGKTARKFSNEKYEKIPYFMWENLWPYFDMWNRHFRISCQRICIPIFITLTWKILHFMQKILYLYFHVRCTENSTFQVGKIVPRCVYVTNRELYISHSEICISIFICETENFIFYEGLCHFRCLYLKKIIPSSRGALIPVILLSFGCCHLDN